MKTIKTVLLCAPFFGLFAVALPGCPSESSEPSTAEEVYCDKMAECGRLGEGVTAEQCAATFGEVNDQIKQEGHSCAPIMEQAWDVAACEAEHGSCEEEEDGSGVSGDDGLPPGHPCFEKADSLEKTIEGMEEQERDELLGCFLAMTMIQEMVTTPATGPACTTHEDCAEVECPDQLFPKPAYCQNSRCKTQDDVCE